ncbi:putative antibiotic ABC transporter protein MutG [Clostridiales bacterium oral taxon 876 str. F0540]|nr:putative antibiotic ABC transporter protein MutG [Clostridiales bacterium oral taxon 876 str. F0540]
MIAFFRLVMADFQKIRRSSILWIHVVIPVLTIINFLSYYSFSKASTFGKVSGYMEMLSIAFPILIGVITSAAVEQESSSGGFQELLMSKHKLMSFFSKFFMLLLLAFTALLAAVGGFALGFKYLLNQNIFEPAFYMNMIIILFGSVIFLYLMHTMCSFIFGAGASIGLGIAESLIAALMLTGLGEGIWRYIPCSWGGRLCNYYMLIETNRKEAFIFMKEFQNGNLICFITTVILIIISLIWFNRFEGRREA